MKIVTSFAVLLEPFLPYTAENIKRMINFVPQVWDDAGTPDVAPSIGKTSILFKKIENETIDVQINKLKKAEVAIEDFDKIQIRVARIIKAEIVEGSKNLVKCLIDIGDARRQIVAGIGKSYTPEELVGKTIMVVANLKPAKIRGVTSQGMLLAAVGEDDIVLLTADRPIEPGAAVK
jgi:methionyl-tRNA synthetase